MIREADWRAKGRETAPRAIEFHVDQKWQGERSRPMILVGTIDDDEIYNTTTEQQRPSWDAMTLYRDSCL